MLDNLYNRDGRPVDFESWALLFHDEEYRHVAFETVGPYEVSTVWLGVDHGHGRTPRPLIFETMVFATAGEGDLGPGVECRRYASVDEALTGHAEAVTLLRATVVTDPSDLSAIENEADTR